MAQYQKSSPFFDSRQNKNNLEVLEYREIPHEVDDHSYVVGKEFAYRPDLLAFDLYDDQNLWWVFQNRNPDVLKDAIFDFKEGTTIRLPKKSTLASVLGL
jgi:hypothetical protein